jgi:hypothetical protein
MGLPMAFNRSALDHRFDDGEKCAKCGMSRKEFDDNPKRCGGRPPKAREGLSIDEEPDED